MRSKLILLALIEGGLVMLLETASPIIVAPVLGHSVLIWATMLSLSVGSLAIGYFLGAWFTKKERSYGFLMRLFFLNSILLLFGWSLLYVQNYLSAELVNAFYSFFVVLFVLILPLIIFGSTTPVIVALVNGETGSDSSTAGSVFSFSTIGGILFSLLTGYFLIDNIGVSATILVGLLLSVVFPFVYFLKEKKRLQTVSSGLVVVVALVFLVRKPDLVVTETFETKHFSEGITGQLIVADFIENKQKNRILLINRMGQTKLNLEMNYSSWPYVNYVTSAASIYPAGSKTLVLGLGGGIVSNQIKHYLGHDVEAVELDERIVALSQEYFDNLNANVRVTADDARRFVKKSDKKYDFIVLDIFNGEIMPSHGLSKEAFEDIEKILKPGGLITINFNGFIDGKEGTAGRSLMRTLKEVGFEVSLFDCGAGVQKEDERNLLYFAYKTTPSWQNAKVHTMIDGKEYKIGEHLMSNPKVTDNNSFVVTDDRPIMEYINRFAAASWRKAYLEGYTKKFRKEHKLPLVL